MNGRGTAVRKKLRARYRRKGGRGYERYTATFVRKSVNEHNLERQDMLFAWVFCGDEFIADHLWVRSTRVLDRLQLVEGDEIQFLARIREYQMTGTARRNYSLTDICHVERIVRRLPQWAKESHEVDHHNRRSQRPSDWDSQDCPDD